MLIATLACWGISLLTGVWLAWLIPGLANAVQAGVLLLRIGAILGVTSVFFLLAAMTPWLRQGSVEKHAG